MELDDPELFLAAPPGLEAPLVAEAKAAGLGPLRPVAGGVTLRGGWPEAMRACLLLRVAARVLVRVARFRVQHLAQLDKRARRIPWAEMLRADAPIRVEAVCHRSKVWHESAAAQRVATAAAEASGAPLADSAEAAEIRILVRIEADVCTISLDAGGAPMHRRGFRQAVGKAPMRETLAAGLLRAAGWDGASPVVDPMCGSGTIPIEAAEVLAGLAPGRARGFAFERLRGFDRDGWEALKAAHAPTPAEGPPRAFGFDRDAGGVAAAEANADRAGVAALCRFACQPVSALEPPEGPPGLVLVNPPWGDRIGDRKPLFALYDSLGRVLAGRFSGWRVGVFTPDRGLAQATGLPFAPLGPPIDAGGRKARLFRTDPLP